MKSYIIETYKDGIIFPFLGVGFMVSRRRSTYGLGLNVVDSIVGVIVIVSLGLVYEFRAMGLNPRVYRADARKRYGIGKKNRKGKVEARVKGATK